jgi:hypothetical protein
VATDPARLAALTCGDFAGCLGQRFRLTREGDAPEAGALLLELLRVDAAPTRDRVPRARAPFSAVFLGPAEPVLPQQIYRLENATLGCLEIFLVPIGRDERGVRYEAVFA